MKALQADIRPHFRFQTEIVATEKKKAEPNDPALSMLKKIQITYFLFKYHNS